MIDQRPDDTTDIDQAPSPADVAAADERLGRVDFTRRLGNRRNRELSGSDRPDRPDRPDRRDRSDDPFGREGEDADLLILPPAKVEAILAAETARLEAEKAPDQPPAAEPPAASGGLGSDRPVDLDLGQSVEEVAASIIASMRAIEENHHRHLEALEAEATRRYELLLAQAELDAELIRLNGRREAHRIIATARSRTGEPSRSPGQAGRLQEIGETFTRFAETIESAAATPPPDDRTT